MERHPGGAEATLRLLELAGLEPPCRIIDLGAGSGEAVRLLRSRGFEALGIDLAPGPDVLPGDILDPPFEPASFDAALSQCAFYLTGAPEQARFGRGRVRYRVSHRRYGGLETILHSRPLERRGRAPRRRGEKLPLSLCDT